MTPLSCLALMLAAIAALHVLAALGWCWWLDHLDWRAEQRALDDVLARVRTEMQALS